MTKQELLEQIKGKVIVSCQAVQGEPLYDGRKINYVSDGTRGKTGGNSNDSH